MASSDLDTTYNLSEVESIDSDWLDLSSRASEDNASLSDIESDHESLSRPLSRQSSASSSNISDRDGWEGLVDNTDDEAPVEGIDGPVLLSVADTPGTVRIRGANIAVHRQVDELQERQALEQSMVSTLNSSRGGSLAASTSATSPLSGSARARDLRLSFPDPLSGSRDELNRSYDDVLVDACSSTPPLVGIENNMEAPVINASTHAMDRSAISRDLPLRDLRLVLYGNSLADKDAVVDTLIKKLGEGMNYTITGPKSSDGDACYTLLERGKQTVLTVRVIDRTNVFAPSSADSQRSLAVVFLPAMLKSLPHHALYLPIAPSLSRDDGPVTTDTARADAERQWLALKTSPCHLLLRHAEAASSVFSITDISALSPDEVAVGFEPLLPHRRLGFRALREQAMTVPAVTLIAILSIMLGYIVSVSSPVGLQIERPPATTVVKEIANVSYPTAIPSPSPVSVNFSSSLVLKTPSSLSIITPAAQSKTLVFAALTPASASSEVSSRAVSSDSTTRCDNAGSCIGSFAILTIASSATPSLSRVQAGVLSLVPSSVKSLITVPTKEHALSTRLESSVSPVLATRSAVSETRELMGALDNIQRAIGGQASSLISALPSVSSIQSSASIAQEQLRVRNNRARDRAQRLRKRGEQVLWEAHERAWGRVERARRRARAIHSRTEGEAALLLEYVQRRWGERAEKREARRARHQEAQDAQAWIDHYAGTGIQAQPL